MRVNQRSPPTVFLASATTSSKSGNASPFPPVQDHRQRVDRAPRQLILLADDAPLRVNRLRRQHLGLRQLSRPRQWTREAQLVAIGVTEVEVSLPPFSVPRRKLRRQPCLGGPHVERIDI